MTDALNRRRFSAWLLAAPLLAACERRRRRWPALPSGATVLALGDSITHGSGAAPPQSYPAVLAELTGWNVLNAGLPGDTSAGALARTPELLQAQPPAAVLLGIGGNDFLRHLSPADTREHIRAICRLVAAAGAQAVLIGVPQPTFVAAATGTLSDHPLYAELAAELDLPLHAGGWARVLGNAALRADAIHANAAGYRAFAQGLHADLRAWGLAA